MLKHHSAAATIAVKDIEVARSFYSDKLGLEALPTMEGMLSYKSASTSLFIYTSEFAGSNEATAVTWNVDDKLGALVEELRSKGVTFEHYDMPNVKLEGDIHVIGDIRNAWFKDPDGNIHSLVGRA